jgi:uncharacterized radical SAM superfamily Fe-S cluster-containing enzyme
MSCFGGEPTVREDLPEIIKIIKENKSIPILYTNGIKISNYSYLKKLKECGLADVHLQFDGFDDKVNLILRGKRLLKTKLKALRNLEKLKIPTVLEVTVARDVNMNEIKKILDFAIRKDFIKAVFFRPYSYLGRVGLPYEKSPIPDEIIDTLEKETGGRISQKGILNFQKFFYAFNDLLPSFFLMRQCFQHRYFLLFRGNGKYKTVNEIFDFEKIHLNLKRFISLKSKNEILAKLYLLASFLKILSAKNLKFSLKVLYKFFVRIAKPAVFTFSNFPKDFLVLTFTVICNPYIFDNHNVPYCHPGEIRTDKIYEAAAIANLSR